MSHLRDLFIERLSSKKQNIEQSNAIWDKRAAVFSTHITTEKDPYLEFFLSHADIKNKTVLDVGCGTGKYLPFFLAEGAIVEGLEPSVKMAEKAKDYLRACEYDPDQVTIHHTALQNFTPEKPYDYVFISNNPVIAYYDNYLKILSLAKHGIFVGSWLESKDALLDYLSDKLGKKVHRHGGENAIYFFNLLVGDTEEVCVKTFPSSQSTKEKEEDLLDRYADWVFGTNCTTEDKAVLSDLLSPLKDSDGYISVDKTSKRLMIFAYK